MKYLLIDYILSNIYTKKIIKIDSCTPELQQHKLVSFLARSVAYTTVAATVAASR